MCIENVEGGVVKGGFEGSRKSNSLLSGDSLVDWLTRLNKGVEKALFVLCFFMHHEVLQFCFSITRF